MTFDWQAAQMLAAQTPGALMVAGGLTPDNVEEAIRLLKPDGVDVSGGVETTGVKDIAKIEQFITAARRGEGPGAK